MMYTVLGSTGFIGSRLADHLRQGGHDVLAPERDSPISLTRFLGHVVYCIGLTADFRSRPFDTVDAHIGRLREILERAHFRSFLYLSSTRVYQRAAATAEDTPLLIDPAAPDDLYNASKLMGEALCLNCGRPGVRVVRLSNVYGTDVTSENFLSSVIRDAVTKARVVVRSSPRSAKDYVCIEDVVAMLPRIGEKGAQRIYNLASGRNTTHGDLLSALSRIAGCEMTFEPGAPETVFPPISIERLRKEFSFEPAHVMDRLERLVQECREKVQVA